MSRSKNRKIADLISGGTFDDGVVAASEVTGLHTVASTGNFNELENKPAPFDPATLAGVAVSGSFNDLSDQPAPFDPAADTTFMRKSANSDLDMNNNDIVGVDQIFHEGDSNTYMQFHGSDMWRVVTGGTERLAVNNHSIIMASTLAMNGHNIDMNNNNITDVEDIYLQDKIYHDGDTDTYMGFSANEWRVVTGGTERLEVNNSRTQIENLEVTGTATFSGTVEGAGGGPPNFDPTTTPDYNLTSSTTWTVPTNSNALWAVFYLVGGGGGGDLQSTYAPSGSGGAAYLTAMLLEALPSTIQIVVGGGGAGGTASPSNGGNTSVTIGSNIWTAAGGYAGAGTSAILAGNTGSVIMPTGGSQYIFSDGDAQGGSRGRYAGIAGNATYYNGSVLGGGGGRGGGRSDTIAGPSLHAGNGGDLSHRNGYAPGGGGAGIKTASLAPANGADGSVRIWLL